MYNCNDRKNIHQIMVVLALGQWCLGVEVKTAEGYKETKVLFIFPFELFMVMVTKKFRCYMSFLVLLVKLMTFNSYSL